MFGQNHVIESMITVFLVLVPVGAIFRMTVLGFQAIHENDKKGDIQGKIKNVMIFAIMAEMILALFKIIQKYYS